MKGLKMDVLCLGLVVADVLVKLKHNSTSFDEDVTIVDEISLSSGGNALVSALAIEQSEEWLTGKRYFNMKELYEGENQILKVDPDIGVVAARA